MAVTCRHSRQKMLKKNTLRLDSPRCFGRAAPPLLGKEVPLFTAGRAAFAPPDR